MVEGTFHTGDVSSAVLHDLLIPILTLKTDSPITALGTAIRALVTVSCGGDVVEIVALLALGVVSSDRAVLAVWLDTGLAEVLGVEVEALLTRVTLVIALTLGTGGWAGLTLVGQLVGPLAVRTGVLALAVLKEEACLTLKAACGQWSGGDHLTGLTVGTTG